MATLLQRIRGRRPERAITTLEDYIGALSSFQFNGNTYQLGGNVQQTLNGNVVERAPNDLTSYAQAAYAGNGVTFACMAVRMLVFSAVRLQYQQLRDGRPGDLFSLPSLDLAQFPWPGGTTQDLLMKMILDADLAGNSYWTVVDGELVRLNPDWTQVVLEPRLLQDPDSRRPSIVGYRKLGYIYQEMGVGSGFEPKAFLADEVAHFAPYPDPLASYRGMSWLTPVIRELQNDNLMSRHQRKYFENGATPNLVVKLDAQVSPEMFERFKAKMESAHAGADNAYKTLYLGGGADATVVGSNFQEVDFKTIKGHGETRIAMAAGVPPVILGSSEGLAGSSLNAGNYGQSRRRFADGTMHPLWANAAGSLQPLFNVPAASRLWYDARDVPFLREDRKDAAEIQQIKATTIRQLVDAGFTPESAVDAVEAEDSTLLEHTGLYSVQLQPPGVSQANNSTSTEVVTT